MKWMFSLVLTALMASACSDLHYLRSDQPIRPVREYERMIVGRLDADYVGDDNCLKKCHKHDKIKHDLQLSVHGAQIAAETGLPLVNCESCHGPGSLAIANIDEHDRCDFDTLLKYDELPAQAQSLICLKCHSVASTPTLHNWNASVHANGDVSCFDCHKLHLGPQQKVSRQEMDELCYGCHQDIRISFQQFSHHPVPEGKMACVDCHNPHGSSQDHSLLGLTVKETCTRCHMEVQGPFVYEHADLTEDCSNCHAPHGAPNNPLLKVSQPFLCLQCHPGHQSGFLAPGLANNEFKGAFLTRCTDCHKAIHGTDIPSAKGRGTFLAR